MEFCCRDCVGELTASCAESGHRVATRRQLEEARAQTTQRDSLDSLPDDVLVDVFRRLPAVDVLRLRRVCRRWRDLLLHREIWRRRHLLAAGTASDGSPNECGMEELDNVDMKGLSTQKKVLRKAELVAAALRVAPCVDKLTLSLRAVELLGLVRVATRTKCAAARLKIQTDSCESDALSGGLAVLIAQLIQNQAALGRLRHLSLNTSWWRKDDANSRSIVHLLQTVHAVQGLQRLDMSHIGSLPSEWRPVSQAPLKPSLKELHYKSDDPDAFLELQLRSHASTLEKVHLMRMKTPCALPVALLDACPRLRKLECPLLEDVRPESFAGVQELSLIVWARSGYFPYAARRERQPFYYTATQRTAAMLSNAAERLTSLSLVCHTSEGPGALAPFLRAASASGSPSVRSLHVKSVTHRLDNIWPDVAAAIPSLPLLEHLDMSSLKVDEDGLAAISPSTAPALKSMSFDVGGCPHCWMHLEWVADFFRRNGRVHAAVLVRRSRMCSECANKPCHPALASSSKTEACLYGQADAQHCNMGIDSEKHFLV